MKKETNKEKAMRNMCTNKSCEPDGCAYILGVIGAAIYYISIAGGFWAGVLGVLKAIIWPVFVVNGLLKFIGA